MLAFTLFGCGAEDTAQPDGEQESFTEGLEYSFSGGTYTVTGVGVATDKDLKIPKKYNGIAVDGISDNAFEDDVNITSVKINGNIRIGRRAFSGCTGLTLVEVNGGEIGDSAFFGCKNLEVLFIGDDVTAIREDAFYGCGKLTVVHLGAGVKSIEDMAFDKCVRLSAVYYKGSVEDKSKISCEEIFNSYLFNAAWYYYSPDEPPLNEEGTAYDGNYWYYDVDGTVTVREYKKE